MRAHRAPKPKTSRPRLLAVSVAIALSSSGFANAERTPQTNQPMTTFVVKNCNDDGPDSLRAAVQAANTLGVDSAIEFDPNSMQCSTITLQTGSIDVTLDNLTIGDTFEVTIDGGYAFGHSNRIFRHTGQGVLKLAHLVLTDASYSVAGNAIAEGGCVRSNGTVYLTASHFDACSARAENGRAAGGAIWGQSVKVMDSVVANSVATSLTQALGGGIYVGLGTFAAQRSTVTSNAASSYSMNPSQGGGVYTRLDATVEASTISGNRADAGAGFSAGGSIALANSTITSNVAAISVGGLVSGTAASIYNSTIALNLAQTSTFGVGVDAVSVTAVSSILAKNTDVSGVDFDVRSYDGQVTGSANLIVETSGTTTLPADTVRACPRLGPLLDNGGETLTLALLPGSPAIDAGYDPFNLGVDQRGSGFDRVIGANADIGAYEFSAGSGDVINRNGFETCD